MREREKNACQCKQEAHEAGKRDEREREREKKLMHGIADPLTKLFLTITAGGINTEASVRAGKRREEGQAISHASHAALQGEPREEAFDGAFTGKT